ncbi:MAG: DUF3793 family protein [Treponema sp.]|nr:DUF3793 family protein [Treponema sp.]
MSFDQAMIHFSAPTICGIKPANLFSVRKECFSTHEFIRWKKTLAEQGVAVKLVKSSNRIFLVLVYNTLWIERLLEDASVRSYLGGKGYKDCPDVAKTVGRIAWRMKNPSCFPHEVGVLLGYPVLDVQEFERNKGSCCNYCGCWKSYSDVKLAASCHCRFKLCSFMCDKWFDEGYSLSGIIEKYKEAVNAA